MLFLTRRLCVLLPKAVCGHRSDITCFAVSGNILVSGSKDTCVIVWKTVAVSSSSKRIDAKPLHILRAHGKSVGLSTRDFIYVLFYYMRHRERERERERIFSSSESRFQTCSLHIDDEVTCVAVEQGLDLVVSGSSDGTIVLHGLFSGRYLRTIR